MSIASRLYVSESKFATAASALSRVAALQRRYDTFGVRLHDRGRTRHSSKAQVLSSPFFV